MKLLKIDLHRARSEQTLANADEPLSRPRFNVTVKKGPRTMNKNPLSKGILTENGCGIGTITLEMVESRARELAAIAGRVRGQASEVDYEQAQRELTGESYIDIEEELFESMPESERWDPVPGSMGHRAPELFGEDEDSEGRSESAQLFEEGIKEAEHDQMLQAALAAQENKG